jgi:hypothetical protein
VLFVFLAQFWLDLLVDLEQIDWLFSGYVRFDMVLFEGSTAVVFI